MKHESEPRFQRISRRELERVLSRIQQSSAPRSALKEKQVEKREPYSVRGFKSFEES